MISRTLRCFVCDEKEKVDQTFDDNLSMNMNIFLILIILSKIDPPTVPAGYVNMNDDDRITRILRLKFTKRFFFLQEYENYIFSCYDETNMKMIEKIRIREIFFI